MLRSKEKIKETKTKKIAKLKAKLDSGKITAAQLKERKEAITAKAKKKKEKSTARVQRKGDRRESADIKKTSRATGETKMNRKINKATKRADRKKRRMNMSTRWDGTWT